MAKERNGYRIFFILIVMGLMLPGCGGGGGGSSPVSKIGVIVPQTGGAQGYVYIPIGAARVSTNAKSVMRAANAAPAGYVTLSGATVACGDKSAITNASGYPREDYGEGCSAGGYSHGDLPPQFRGGYGKNDGAPRVY